MTQQNNPDPRGLADTAHYFQVREDTIKGWITDGYLRPVYLNGQPYVPSAEIRRLIIEGSR